MKKILLGLILLTGCTTLSPGGPSSNYGETVEKWTGHSEEYENLHESYRVRSTLLSRDLVEKQLELDNRHYKWTPDQLATERQKALYDLQTQTTVFVSLYTEKDEDNSLDKSHTPWNIFLEVGGKRYPPTQIKRVYENRVVLMNKYPYLDNWSRNYTLKFPIPTDDASQNNPHLNITGPVGHAEIAF